MLYKSLFLAALLAASANALHSFNLKKKTDKEFVAAIVERASKGIKLGYKVISNLVLSK